MSRQSLKDVGSLVLSFGEGQSALLDFGGGVTGAVQVVELRGGRVRLRISLPRAVRVIRSAILDEPQRESLREICRGKADRTAVPS